MKTKSISKIISVLFAIVMTTCLTSCEDESVPAYGTGVESDGGVHHNLSPNPPTETEPQADLDATAFIRTVDIGYDPEIGEYIYVYVFITNNTDEKMEAWRLAQVGVLSDQELPLQSLMIEVMGDKHEDTSRMIKPGDQDFIIEKFYFPDYKSTFLDVRVSVWDNTTQENVIVDSRRLYLTEE